MKTEEYLKKLTDQIRCAKARAAIAEEMRGHIDEQKHAYMSVGMEAGGSGRSRCERDGGSGGGGEPAGRHPPAQDGLGNDWLDRRP